VEGYAGADAMTIGELYMPAYHNRPSSPTNLTLHEAIDIKVPIGCSDVAVFPGDIMVGDDDSVIVIPFEIADEIADEAAEMTAYEDVVTEKVNAGIGFYPAMDECNLALFTEWRHRNGK
jgi:regulator of RNase E activity RraA